VYGKRVTQFDDIRTSSVPLLMPREVAKVLLRGARVSLGIDPRTSKNLTWETLRIDPKTSEGSPTYL
jgi:hypothetical protein